jgi:hypothetical protein
MVPLQFQNLHHLMALRIDQIEKVHQIYLQKTEIEHQQQLVLLKEMQKSL